MTKFIQLAIWMLFASTVTAQEHGRLLEDFDRSGEMIQVTTTFYKSQGAVNRAFGRLYGSHARNTERVAFSAFVRSTKKGEPHWCHIHALEPTSINDKKMDNLGHELFHCIKGSFHK